ncbi:hypothetical protein JOF29_003673 [Kribbella aluminosa]|uniref:Uncharacterized protein n=1 Tax=Kribbella aluminosa TaxID=416017 RepID=A0ABS4ULT9_9ACTN|nr:hypothetical protein [Kribbella aluminosa]MBP2352590.1 hypothetical protein [Kribbella aluminosa]
MPVVTLNPKMLPRLDEIEGVDLTLTFLRTKRTQTRRSAVLGMSREPHSEADPRHTQYL